MSRCPPSRPIGQSQTFVYDHRDRLVQASTSGHTINSYTENASYSPIGNLLTKGASSYTYPASGATSVHPHAVSVVGGLTYTYDDNGNLLSGGGRTYTWNAQNQPTQISMSGVTESYAYDADGGRVKRTVNGATTYYLLGGLLEVEPATSTLRWQYAFNGRVVAQRTLSGATNTVLSIHSDHLGSAVMTSKAGGAYSVQEYKPWGGVRAGSLPETTIDYTGQKKDDTGLLFYNARYYDPVIARFVSADSIVPGTSAGSGGAAATVGSGATTSLTVDFHEGEFVSQLNGVNAQRQGQGFWFELSGQQKQQAEGPSGPANPQTLNRYSYVLNNPLRYTDPSGHHVVVTRWETYSLITTEQQARQVLTAIFDILQAAGAEIEVGANGEFVSVSANAAMLVLGPAFYRFLVALMFHIQTILGSAEGWGDTVLWIQLEVREACTGVGCDASARYSFGECINGSTGCSPNSSNSTGSLVDIGWTVWYSDWPFGYPQLQGNINRFARLQGQAGNVHGAVCDGSEKRACKIY